VLYFMLVLYCGCLNVSYLVFYMVRVSLLGVGLYVC